MTATQEFLVVVVLSMMWALRQSYGSWRAVFYLCWFPLYCAALIFYIVMLRKLRRVAKIGMIVGFAYLGSVVVVFLLSGILADPNLPVMARLMAIEGAPLYIVTILGGWIRLRFAA